MPPPPILDPHSHQSFMTFPLDMSEGFEPSSYNLSFLEPGVEDFTSHIFLLNSSLPSSPQLLLPPEFREMSSRSRNEVVAYSILFLVAATGNLTVFFSVCHQLAKLKWRITVLMLHLSIADLIVTFFLMPLEIFWRLTIQWLGGELLCKLCQFLRAFGLYLSSNILICISLDRFIAILFPLRMVGATRRVKTMIAIAWLSAALSAAPQCVVFSLQVHPKYPSFKQCVSFGFFSSPSQEMIYNVFSVSAMYFIPLVATVFTYSMILWKISSKSHGLLKQTRAAAALRNNKDGRNTHHKNHCNISNNRGSMGCCPQSTTLLGPNNAQQSNTNTTHIVGSSESANLLARAKKRTLRMTFVIVIVFVFCWTPYAIITLWYTFDKEGAKSLDPSLQDILFMMAVANSCLNPIVYGNYTKKTAGRIFNCRWSQRMTDFQCCFNTAPGNGRRRVSIEEGTRVGNDSYPMRIKVISTRSEAGADKTRGQNNKRVHIQINNQAMDCGNGGSGVSNDGSHSHHHQYPQRYPFKHPDVNNSRGTDLDHNGNSEIGQQQSTNSGAGDPCIGRRLKPILLRRSHSLLQFQHFDNPTPDVMAANSCA